MHHGHPPLFGDKHPWRDPLTPQDIFDPRPDAELAIAGPLAPQPEEFPYTEEGRREYYDAVRTTAQMMQRQVGPPLSSRSGSSHSSSGGKELLLLLMR